MILWLDAHLSPRIARWITHQLQIEASALRDHGLRDAEDLEIWEAAKVANAVIVTKDSDFAELVRRLGAPPRVIWITCGNTSEAHLMLLLEANLQVALDLIRDGEPIVEIS